MDAAMGLGIDPALEEELEKKFDQFVSRQEYRYLGNGSGSSEPDEQKRRLLTFLTAMNRVVSRRLTARMNKSRQR